MLEARKLRPAPEKPEGNINKKMQRDATKKKKKYRRTPAIKYETKRKTLQRTYTSRLTAELSGTFVPAAFPSEELWSTFSPLAVVPDVVPAPA